MVQRICLLGCLLAAGMLVFVGCGQTASGLKTVKVSGKITYGGGEWPATAAPTLSFTPVAGSGGGDLHNGSATVKTDGSFEATTSSPGDGLVPGKYQVAVQAWDPPGGLADNPNAKSLVPKQFESGATSGLTVDVPAGSAPVNVTWDVPKGS